MSQTRNFAARRLQGHSLTAMCEAPMELGLFLKIATRAAGALADLHRQGVVHLSVCPQNIYIDPASGEVRICGQANGEDAVSPRSEQKGPRQPSFPYMAPEQTGRMNRSPDHRADLYSLGITFYQMLTGRLPFTAEDPLQWVHCHIARTPLPPSAILPELPPTVSDIIMKLLAKVPEDRYQSASGLQFDLQHCSAQWDARGQVAPFALATRDVSECFQISHRLYGRQAELELLTGTFGRVAGSGKPEMVLITGYSGIGKSSLVHQLCKPVMREGGYFLSGKFEQRKHDIPELQPAIREGLLYSNQACHFAHDRVYEAAYLLMPASQRAEVHLRLGRLLLAHSSQASLDENVFDIVNQVRVRC